MTLAVTSRPITTTTRPTMISMLELRIQKLDCGLDLPLPKYMTTGAAGMDLCAADNLMIPSGEWRAVHCGFVMAIPDGYEAQIRPRSGLAAKHGVTVLNAPGTIDSDYRGEVMAILINHGPRPFAIQYGDRIAQMIVAKVERAEVVEANELPASKRGSGGFGHTGR